MPRVFGAKSCGAKARVIHLTSGPVQVMCGASPWVVALSLWTWCSKASHADAKYCWAKAKVWRLTLGPVTLMCGRVVALYVWVLGHLFVAIKFGNLCKRCKFYFVRVCDHFKCHVGRACK